jgi:hypothetical protein
MRFAAVLQLIIMEFSTSTLLQVPILFRISIETAKHAIFRYCSHVFQPHADGISRYLSSYEPEIFVLSNISSKLQLAIRRFLFAPIRPLIRFAKENTPR